MIQISRNLDKQGYDLSIGSYNVEYLRRRNGDLQFRDWSASNKDLSGFREFPYATQDHTLTPARVKAYGAEKNVDKQGNEKVYQMDMSM